MRSLRLGKGALELLDVGQQALLLARDRLRLGEGGFEALDLAAQLSHLRRVGLDRERRFRARLGLFGHVLGLAASGVSSATGLGLFGFLDPTTSSGSGCVSMASGTASGSAESASVPSSLGSGAGCAGGATAVAASRSFGRPPLVSSGSVSSSFGGTPSAKPYSVLSAPPLCMASACATAAPDAKPSSTMIWPSGRFDCCCTSSTVASCSSLMSPSSVISSPSWRCGMRSLSEEALMPDSRPAAGESRRLYRR